MSGNYIRGPKKQRQWEATHYIFCGHEFYYKRKKEKKRRERDTTMENNKSRVCVTGGSGYIGSWLVKKLLEKGHFVHATLRNCGDASKVGLLKSLPNAENRLVLFQADIYNPDEFEPAIEGCEYVFHVATPMVHTTQSSKYKDTSEAAVAGVKRIANSCIRSQTVKRLIYTASMMAASPLTKDGVFFKSCIDESCWTPLDVSLTYSNDFFREYTKSKTLAEKEVLNYNELADGKLEVVTLPCALVGGETLLPNVPATVGTLLSPLTGNLFGLNALKLLQELWGSIALAHIDDICQAHIFCIEKPSMKGRFLCAATNPTINQIAIYFQQNFPEYQIPKEFMEEPDEGNICFSRKLMEMGFEYTYDMKKILDDCVACGRRLRALT